MSVAFGAAGAQGRAAGGTGGDPITNPHTVTLSGTDIPAGAAGDGWVVPLFWGNAEDADPSFSEAVYSLLGESEGGAGSWGVNSGTRHVTGLWTEDDLTGTSQVFTGNGTPSTESLIGGYVTRWTKSLAYWRRPEIAVAPVNLGGPGATGTFNRDPGFTDGDQALLVIVANSSLVNPAGIVLTMPGTTQGTGTTGILTSAFTQGNDVRVTLRRVTITGTSNGGLPTVTSTTAFTGTAMLIRLRDTASPPVAMSAGADLVDVEPGSTVELDSSESTYVTAGRTWSQTAGPAVTLSSTTATAPTFVAPYTMNGTTLTFRVTDNATGLYDEVNVGVDYASSRVRGPSGWVPEEVRLYT